MRKIPIVAILVTCVMAGSASASQITWGGPAGMSVMTNPNAMSVISSSILQPQANELQTDASNRAAATSAASANSSNTIANELSQQIQANIAASISASINGTNGSASNGTFNLGNGQTISYDRGSGNTSVTIDNPGQSPLTLTFPNIQ